MCKSKPLGVTYERCHELLEVCEPSDPGKQSGLKWKVNRRRVKVGNWAGFMANRVKSSGLIREEWIVRIDGKNYYAARIIYFMTHGEDPYPLEVDHINRDSRDNRVDNLRLAKEPGLQKENRGIRKDNKSGITGVCWDKKAKKWRVEVKGHKLGRFATRKEAAAAKNEGVRKYYLKETQEANLVDLDTITD